MVADINATFSLVRIVIFSVVSVFSCVVLALGAAITHFTNSAFFGGYFQFAALGIATAVLTLLTLPAMLFFSGKGAFTSLISIEIAWTWILWIMWLSTGGDTAGQFWLSYCSTFFDGTVGDVCHETQALAAFSFLNWILLISYNITLLTLVTRQHLRGNTSVWQGFVTETDYAAPGTNSGSQYDANTMVNPTMVNPTMPQQYDMSTMVNPTMVNPTMPQAESIGYRQA